MSGDTVALVASFAYVFAAIGVAEGLRRWCGYTVEFTRKVIHVCVGMWAYGTVWLFDRRALAVIPPLCFVAINAVSYLHGTFAAMETGEKSRLGTVYFPISFSVIILLLWDRPHLMVASLMPMTWGDALASVVGRRVGRRTYTCAGTTRSLEGSVVFFAASWVATAVPLAVLGQASLGTAEAAAVAAATAAGSAVVEAVSPWGIDNLSVPAISALILTLLL
ncbi:MAG: phosphatidate cytidylyltransferase [Anaerolineae bacterium]|jgi:phytol kinase